MKAQSRHCVQWLGVQVDKDGSFRIGRTGDLLVADFEGIGILRANRAGGPSVFEPAEGADPLDVEKLRAGIVPALLRHLDRKLTLHGSAVEVDGKAVACIGESGAGKSTLAARLCAAGAALIADDTTAIEFQNNDVVVVPTEKVHWLVAGKAEPSETGGTKDAVEPLKCARRPYPLVAICRLRFDDALRYPEVRHLGGPNAIQALVPTVIRFLLDEREARLLELDQLSRILQNVQIVEIARPRGAALIEPTVACVRKLAQSQSRREQS